MFVPTEQWASWPLKEARNLVTVIAEPRDRPVLYTWLSRTGKISITFVCLWGAIQWTETPYQRKSYGEPLMKWLGWL